MTPIPLPGHSADRPARIAVVEDDRDLRELTVEFLQDQGYATLGTIGFEGRRDYAAIGSVCNLASRLCGEAKAGQILVSQKVFGFVEERVVAEAVGELSLKGFHNLIPAFNVTGFK